MGAMTSLPRALAPLRHSQYRLLVASMALSLLAAGLWAVAVVWQVVALGGGPAALSLVAALAAGGMLATTLLGGALADRIPQRRILLATELLQGTTMAVVAALSLAGVARAVAAGRDGAGQRAGDGALLPGVLGAGAGARARGRAARGQRPRGHGPADPAERGRPGGRRLPGGRAVPRSGPRRHGRGLAAGGGVPGGLSTTPVRRDPPAEGEEAAGLLADVREGFVYMVRTPWLLATLLFASLMLLVFIGPLEVLVPFAIKDAGGGPTQHGYVLAAFGVGGAVGSLVVASFRLPRRYLTVMNLLWGLGCIPLVVFGFRSDLWLMITAGAVMGATFQAGMVIWGTLLQRRVPPALLGRVSSLDFFVSLSFMPLSMALAGTVSEVIGLTATFLSPGWRRPSWPSWRSSRPASRPTSSPTRSTSRPEPAPDLAEERLDRV